MWRRYGHSLLFLFTCTAHHQSQSYSWNTHLLWLRLPLFVQPVCLTSFHFASEKDRPVLRPLCFCTVHIWHLTLLGYLESPSVLFFFFFWKLNLPRKKLIKNILVFQWGKGGVQCHVYVLCFSHGADFGFWWPSPAQCGWGPAAQQPDFWLFSKQREDPTGTDGPRTIPEEHWHPAGSWPHTHGLQETLYWSED